MINPRVRLKTVTANPHLMPRGINESEKRMFDYYSVFRALACALIYGVMENRLFFEEPGDYVFGHHFKLYHVFMLLLFAVISFTPDLLLWLTLIVLMPFIEDASWQIISKRKLQQNDWSNLGGFRLLHGIYLWYVLDVLAALALIAAHFLVS